MKAVSDKIAESEAELEQLRIQRDAKLCKIGNLLSDTCIIDKNEVGTIFTLAICRLQGLKHSSLGQQRCDLDLGNSP